ncbi:MAG: hypothetical protein NT062_00520, partial [Proteobacteria bacterium]|nr:hypothetical protein [Pseudomonadota bacterium]
MSMKGTYAVVAAVVALASSACSDPPPGRTFFERTIQPILAQKCAGNTSGCHSVNDGDVFKFAAGNLDVTTYDNLKKRRDLLTPFGPYSYPALLIKAVGPKLLKLNYSGKFLPIDVQHSGGAILEPGSDAFYTLQSWLDNGATENGLKPATPAQQGSGPCSTAVPSGFDPSTYTSNAQYAAFKTTVQPILTAHNCTAGSCHGAPQSDFYITCGADETQLAFNFSQTWSFVNNPVADSQILRVPLAVGAGGRGHTGGDQFASNSDGDYKAIETWATAIGKLDVAAGDPVKTFFADNVQPILLQRGCAFQGCHSPQATNDFKLRSGTQGFFSAVALGKNYDLMRNEFMALEFPDVRRGRAVGKTVLFDDPRTTSVAGIAHRGGPVLETAGSIADPALCPPFNAMTSSPFCTVQEWLRLERAQLATANQVTSMNNGDTVPLVFVERPTGQAAGRLEFDTFQGGADLRVATMTFGAAQQLGSVDAGTTTSLLGGCAGLTAGTADVQAPDVANDGTRVAFAARNSANEPLSVWIVDIDGSNCTQVTPPVADANGLKVHNFDPAWAPDGNVIVFASTRGGAAGPTRSRKRFLPQSDLWRVGVAGHTVDQSSLTQMTWLSNSEISPQYMREGRVTMTTEKASDGFYQLSGRRINWDLTDYHPLLAQRAISPYAFDGMTKDLAATKPSIDYSSATDIRESSNGDFYLVLSDVGPDGAPVLRGAAGALAIFNRSIG